MCLTGFASPTECLQEDNEGARLQMCHVKELYRNLVKLSWHCIGNPWVLLLGLYESKTLPVKIYEVEKVFHDEKRSVFFEQFSEHHTLIRIKVLSL